MARQNKKTKERVEDQLGKKNYYYYVGKKENLKIIIIRGIENGNKDIY